MIKYGNNSSLLMEIDPGLSLMLGLPRINFWETGSRPKNAKRGTFGFNSETNSLEYYNGTYWLAAKMHKGE